MCMTSVQVRSLCLFGSICAGVAGAAFVVMVVCALFAPTSIVTYVASEQYFEDFVAYKNKFILLKWMMVIANLALIGVVCAFFFSTKGGKRGNSHLGFRDCSHWLWSRYLASCGRSHYGTLFSPGVRYLLRNDTICYHPSWSG